MKIAAAAYPLDWLESWSAYEDKISSWVKDAADAGADLLVFPEYGAMELATLAGANVAADLEQSLFAVSDRMDEATQLHRRLAIEHDVHILAASGPVAVPDGRPVNRAHFLSSDGKVAHQDKQIMTKFERDPWDVAPGGPLTLFETDLGRIGVLICYDSEFPLLGRALKDVDFLLVPSCTEAASGYWRVRIGAMARALEAQCVSVMSSLVGPADWSEAVDISTGTGGVFGPPDIGFPADGVLSLGQMDQPGWTYAEIDTQRIAEVRENGIVANRAHWDEQIDRSSTVTISDMRRQNP
ncbi:MAG: carbon-nitrogen hydrolase family protein [Arenibacterium sp.]